MLRQKYSETEVNNFLFFLSCEHLFLTIANTIIIECINKVYRQEIIVGLGYEYYF